MPKAKKTWREKLQDSKGLPKVETVGVELARRWGVDADGATCVIPAPVDVDAAMKRVTKGRLITINELRRYLAKRHAATTACPITTGIFAWIAAHAAEEAAAGGAKRITPYWRTLKSNGELNPKYPGGLEALKRRLEAEGHTVTTRGMRSFVDGFESRLFRLD
jgi:hypothetical protein